MEFASRIDLRCYEVSVTQILGRDTGGAILAIGEATTLATKRNKMDPSEICILGCRGVFVKTLSLKLCFERNDRARDGLAALELALRRNHRPYVREL